jgi:hypothetical protein
MELLSKFNSLQSANKMELKKTLLALKILNNSHPRLHTYGDTPHVAKLQVKTQLIFQTKRIPFDGKPSDLFDLTF